MCCRLCSRRTRCCSCSSPLIDQSSCAARLDIIAGCERCRKETEGRRGGRGRRRGRGSNPSLKRRTFNITASVTCSRSQFFEAPVPTGPPPARLSLQLLRALPLLRSPVSFVFDCCVWLAWSLNSTRRTDPRSRVLKLRRSPRRLRGKRSSMASTKRHVSILHRTSRLLICSASGFCSKIRSESRKAGPSHS